MTLTLSEKALLCYNSALDKKALDVLALDLRGISDVADVFLIASGTSRQQVQTIINAVEESLRGSGERSIRIEGYESARWALLDAGDVIVHVFQEETREYYGLDRLWGDAAEFAFETAA
ncbi:MAG: ribosome silencing factor [Nitrospinae bacterium]|nr:ribosome silencing factor [Nitrospinota bacterium]